MSIKFSDIADNEIRIISKTPSGNNHRHSRLRVLLSALVVVFLLVIVAAIYFLGASYNAEDIPAPSQTPGKVVVKAIQSAGKSYTSSCDTTVNGTKLKILTPINAVPTLEIGYKTLSDSNIVLIAQAADIRGDKGGIVGAFVLKGELLSRGEAKAGFCSIINGEITVGAADATPMLEQALSTDGYFFRQYPLVVGGQIIENKPRGKSIRKALADIDGRVCVVVSEEALTFHGFSQALVNIGVRNAIYLVGSISQGFYRDADGHTFTIGSDKGWHTKMVNYIVWR